MDKFNQLKEYLKSLKKVAVAYSGGVDSTFLLYVAHEVLKDNILALSAKANFFPKKRQMKHITFVLSIILNILFLILMKAQLKIFPITLITDVIFVKPLCLEKCNKLLLKMALVTS